MDNIRYLFSLSGALIVIFEPTLPIIIICTLVILYDCFTACALARRVAHTHPQKASGEISSRRGLRVVNTILKVYSIVILAHLIDTYILLGIPIKLTNVVAGMVCFWHLWSMCENESSCNDSKWAKIVQRIMVDKTERHFDIELPELKQRDPDEKL